MYPTLSDIIPTLSYIIIPHRNQPFLVALHVQSCNIFRHGTARHPFRPEGSWASHSENAGNFTAKTRGFYSVLEDVWRLVADFCTMNLCFCSRFYTGLGSQVTSSCRRRITSDTRHVKHSSRSRKIENYKSNACNVTSEVWWAPANMCLSP